MFVPQKEWTTGLKGGCSVPKEGHPPSAQPPFGGEPSGLPGAGTVQWWSLPQHRGRSHSTVTSSSPLPSRQVKRDQY